MPYKGTQGPSVAEKGTALDLKRSQGYLNEEIAEMIGCDQSTLGRWNKEDKWPLWALYRMGFRLYLEIEDDLS